MNDDSIQSMGGKARAESLTDEQRKQIAQNAAAARWGLPKATHTGFLNIPGVGVEIEGHNLPDGTRLLSRLGVLKAIGRTGKAKGGRAFDDEFGLPVFLTAQNLKPFITKELAENSKPVRFIPHGGGAAVIGYKAELLPQICEVFLKLRDDGQVLAMQKHIVKQADILMRGLAHVGIIALVDEATGYQEVRDRIALQKILEKYITDEWAKWTRTFPEDFYKNLFRLKGLTYPYDTQSKRKPSFVGHWTNDIVYSRLAPGVLDALRKNNPRTETGNRSRKHHQHLTRDYGHPALKEHLSNVTFLMKTCQTDGEFKKRLDFAAPKHTDTPMLLDV
jgi:hypothetical protein